MRAKRRSRLLLLKFRCPLLLLLLAQASCSWVDSAGISSSDGDNETGNATTLIEVFVDDQPVDEVNTINEQSESSIVVARQVLDAELDFDWSSEPTEQGNLGVCALVNGFNTEFAADSLQQACKSSEDCQLDFELVTPDAEASVIEFSLTVPALDASVGVRHELSVTDDEGNLSVTEYNFCLIAINEAPSAQDDTFTVVEGDNLIVEASDPDNLLTNDEDDSDVTNQSLTVRPDPARAPQFAESFTLGTDGSFTYQSSSNPSPVDRSDSFDYIVTDGLFDVTATATIRIVAVNRPPSLDAPLDPFSATEGENFSVDLAPNVIDPEAGPVTFSLSPATPLVAGTGLSLSTTGVLSGIPTAADVGSYVLVVLASDGLLETDIALSLEVAPAPITQGNEPPVFLAGSVSSQSITLRQAMRAIVPQFTDDERLTYRLNGTALLPTGVSINTATGVISGTPTQRGVFSGLRIRATDPSGAFALSTTFTLTVTIF